jgi:hypothetical protein
MDEQPHDNGLDGHTIKQATARLKQNFEGAYGPGEIHLEFTDGSSVRFSNAEDDFCLLK